MKIKLSILTLLLSGFAIRASAQHEMHMMGDSSKKDTTQTDHGMHQMKGMQTEVPMSHAYSLNLPMQRNGSGTAWLPDASPMYGLMFHSKKWMYMLHGNVALRYTKQDVADKGSRGGDKFDAPNWFMFMGQRKVGGKGLFHFSSML